MAEAHAEFAQAAIEQILLAEETIVFAYLFGSLARGQDTRFSDVDIAVYLKEPFDYAEQKMALFDRLAGALDPGTLDLVVLNRAPISLVGRIIQERRVLVDKEPFLRCWFESLRLREFFDFQIKEKKFFEMRFRSG